jgi:hypothetical protein
MSSAGYSALQVGWQRSIVLFTSVSMLQKQGDTLRACVFFKNSGVLVHTSPLPLPPKEILLRVLTHPVAEEHMY